MPIDFGQVDWPYVAVLAIFVFFANFLANLISLSHRAIAAFLAAVVFSIIFVFWSYYPHSLPFKTLATEQKPPSSAGPPAASAAPEKPHNPVVDITPPSTSR
jgi:hypothetical protein